MTKIIVEENVSQESFILPNGNKKFIKYIDVYTPTPGDMHTPNLDDFDFKTNYDASGKLTANHMTVTICDSEGNIIKQEVRKNEYQNWEKYNSIIADYHKKYPNRI